MKLLLEKTKNFSHFLHLSIFTFSGQEAGIVTTEGDVQITPFNMKEEMEEGHFDSEGMYHWNKEATVRDNWLENIDWIKVSVRNIQNVT